MDVERKILIVEDNIEQLEALEATLSKVFRVLSTSNLHEARQTMSEDLALVLVGIGLDDERPEDRDGILFLEEIKERYPKTPVVIMSAYGDPALKADMKRAGAFDYLSKPFDSDELQSIIARALSPRPKLGFKQFVKGYTRSSFSPLLLFISVVLTWELVVQVFNVPNYVIPAPHEVAVTIKASALDLLENTGITMLEAVLGFLLGSIFGFVSAIGFAHSRTIEKSAYPYMIALKAIPLVAIAPLLSLWFGNGILGKVVMAGLMCFFPTLVNTTIGLKAINEEALGLMNSMSASIWQIFVKLRLPTSLPYFFSALKISSTLAVVGAIVAELVGSNRGIGYTILIATYHLNTNMLFAAIAAASIGGIIFFSIIGFLEKRFLYWHESTLGL